jgi:uncharacterized membrane protein
VVLDPSVMEWVNLIVRWVHVFAGILWVGQTYYFTWLDGQFSRDADKVWMVHSGGFYVVEKQKAPKLLPRKLHWFKWEAAFTWLSGMILLTLVYYMGGALLDNDVSRISLGAGIAIGLGAILVSWIVYDLMVRSALADSETLFAAISFVLIVGTAYGLSRVLSARAAYMHVGATLGTLMTLNVWMRILPAQRKMVAALQAGQGPDLTLGARAKLRSKHNTFMVVPVVFLMISNHFPVATYGHPYGWAILGVLVLAGWSAASVIRRS